MALTLFLGSNSFAAITTFENSELRLSQKGQLWEAGHLETHLAENESTSDSLKIATAGKGNSTINRVATVSDSFVKLHLMKVHVADMLIRSS